MNKQTKKKNNIRNSPCEEGRTNKSQNVEGKLYIDPPLPTTVAGIYYSCALLRKKVWSRQLVQTQFKTDLGIRQLRILAQ